MGRFIILSFVVMGWAFYELSGGSDFVPETRALAEAEAPQAEIVTRADTATLVSLTEDTGDTAPIVASLALPLLQGDATQTLPEDDAAPVAEVAAVIAPATVAPAADLRRVGGARVNMRAGPGTDFAVVVTLDQNTQVEVLGAEADWLRVTVPATGTEGWIAARLLTAPN